MTSGKLVTGNPNLYQPKRLARQALTCDQNHSYTPEQKAGRRRQDGQFVQNVSVDTCTGLYGAPGLTMDYYDGNTVTGLWNYAAAVRHVGQLVRHDVRPVDARRAQPGLRADPRRRRRHPVTHQPTTDSYAVVSPDANGVGTVINDPDPAYDDCSDSNHTSTNNLAATDRHKNVGDLLNARGVTWGWFQGGFSPTTPTPAEWHVRQVRAAHTNIGGASIQRLQPAPHPFEYYASTSNPHHLPPSSVAKIGHTDQANHSTT